ncbi:hypothetical protein [Sphingobium fuliginis]|uniref:Uncharacterized protein n=1 Tax=Sphingobium fuliginis ATCC 27551 TaxID=1208342 RepID=A0A5B8CGF5_SPHSA|nr:hypothetical protein [Sphingobium fuliginis]QDC37060.1 hypothetical protein FIL70_07330 [Sphingobium fuliginis ATCC 27551]
MTTDKAPVTVEQVDREAAVDIHNVILHDWFTQHMLDGMEDECYVIQAFAKHRLQSIAALEEEIKGMREALDDLQQAEAEYRLMHDRHGDGSRAAGRAWDLMRRSGDKARTALEGRGS